MSYASPFLLNCGTWGILKGLGRGLGGLACVEAASYEAPAVLAALGHLINEKRARFKERCVRH